MRVKLLDYHAAVNAGAADLEDDETWRLHEPDLSWRIWRLWKSFDFQVPLFDGGVLAYPDWLMEDIAVLNWLFRIVEQQFKK